MLMLQLGVGLCSGEPDKEVHAAFKKCDKDGNQSIDFVRTRLISRPACYKKSVPWSLPPLTHSPLLGSFPLASASSYRMSS